MLQKTLILLFTCLVFFSYFVLIGAYQNSKGIHRDVIRNSEQDVSVRISEDKEIQSLKTEDCVCENGNCVHEDGNETCKCYPGFGNITRTKCKACNCGQDINCMWKPGFLGSKICFCPPGFSQKGPECVECDCGPNGTCKFVKKEKICSCKKGFLLKNGKCAECDCVGKGTCSFDKGERVCKCDPGYSIKDGICEECDCFGKGTCSFDKGEKFCICDSGYSLKDVICEECDCGGKGKCSFVKGEKVCKCDPGYNIKDGICEECYCGSKGNCSFENGVKKCNCANGFLLNDGKCTECDCGPKGICSYENDEKTCACLTGFVFKDGICTECDCGPKGICSYENGEKTCACLTGFVFKDGKCTDNGEKNACDNEHLCKNGGTCIPKSEMNYECNCRRGFIGRNCEINQWCNEVCGLAPCQYNESRESGVCICQDGLYFNAKIKSCKKLDKCLFQRIKGNCSGDHETCDQKGKCECEKNYAYNDDRSACEPDFCWKQSNNSRCEMNMECNEEDANFSCSCKKGYRQVDKKCVKADMCAPGLSHCQQICKDGKCSCFGGFSINKDGFSCDYTEPPSKCSLECGIGSCVKQRTKEMCICPEISHIFKKGNCIDRCKANMLKIGECPKEVGCMSDEKYGYRCNCTWKYEFAEDGVHCRAKRMCSEGHGNDECSLKGGLCEDNFAMPKGYKCKCKFGYKENPKTSDCEHMCKTADCGKKQALCIINVHNNAECICPPLLIKDTDGKCSLIANYSYIGDFSVPKKKYQVSSGEESGKLSYRKLLKDFTDSMKNIFEGYEGASVLNCTAEDIDWKCFLELKLSKDPQGKINIISSPSVCLPLSDELYCLIPPEFITRKRAVYDGEVFHKTDPCDKGVFEKLCGNETQCQISKQGFACKCKSGYSKIISLVPARNIQIEVCKDIDECVNPTICPNTTTCSNLPGNYTCKCIDGYRLEERKSVKRDGCTAICNPNPCVHGTCLEMGRDGFSCICEGIYIGRFCNQTNDDMTGIKLKGDIVSNIVGPILGTFLVVVIIVCIILFRKLQKHKSTNDSKMGKFGQRQAGKNDAKFKENELSEEDRNYNIQYPMNPIDGSSHSRSHLGFNSEDDLPKRHEISNYRKSYASEYKMSPELISSQHSAEEACRKMMKRRDNILENDLSEIEDQNYNIHYRMDPIDAASSSRYNWGVSIDDDIPKRRERNNYKKVYTSNDKISSELYSSRHSVEEPNRKMQRHDNRQEISRKPLSKSIAYFNTENSKLSRMEYRNRGYEEE